MTCNFGRFTRVATIRLPTRGTCTLLTLALLTVVFLTSSIAQTDGGHMLYGDFKVDESKVTGTKPLSFDLILYSSAGRVVARQTVVNNSRYRFMELSNGDYEIVVELESNEVVRIPVQINEPFNTDMRRDIELEWRENLIENNSKKSRAAPADFYERTSTNKKRFAKAAKAMDENNYAQAMVLLRQILSEDEKDYQSWSELGTAYLIQKHFSEAESAYLRATEANPAFFLAFFNLGKLRMAQAKFEIAVEPLSQAVKIRPESPEANYQLGETYLQIKKGSKAVVYLYEALKLDPIGMAEAHLRLAALYNRAGMKDKAAAEYEEFLKKKPDYPDRRKLEEYIAQNKKQ
ncbi:MAG: tetratricopeptide repeat protein [bacterium]